jgi:hypothetical protein
MDAAALHLHAEYITGLADERPWNDEKNQLKDGNKIS